MRLDSASRWGANRVRKVTTSLHTAHEVTGPQRVAGGLSKTHNPKVAGSIPAPATSGKPRWRSDFIPRARHRGFLRLETQGVPLWVPQVPTEAHSQRLDLRTVWTHEAREFTPWLARNIGKLGEMLGIELELADTEVAAGGFCLDLLSKAARSWAGWWPIGTILIASSIRPPPTQSGLPGQPCLS